MKLGRREIIQALAEGGGPVIAADRLGVEIRAFSRAMADSGLTAFSIDDGRAAASGSNIKVADPAVLRGLISKSLRSGRRRDDRSRLLIRTDTQLVRLATAVVGGLTSGLSCVQIAAGLPPWADENLVRAFVRAVGLDGRVTRRGTWAQYHARKAASGEPYTCRRGKGVSYE